MLICSDCSVKTNTYMFNIILSKLMDEYEQKISVNYFKEIEQRYIVCSNKEMLKKFIRNILKVNNQKKKKNDRRYLINRREKKLIHDITYSETIESELKTTLQHKNTTVVSFNY